MRYHLLKTVNPYFQHIYDGVKTFDYRKNDRNFQTGDYLVLVEYDKEIEEFPYIRFVVKEIGSILWGGEFGLPETHVILSLLPASSTCHEVEDLLKELGYE